MPANAALLQRDHWRLDRVHHEDPRVLECRWRTPRPSTRTRERREQRHGQGQVHQQQQPKLTVLATGGSLHLYNVSCFGVINSGDSVNYDAAPTP